MYHVGQELWRHDVNRERTGRAMRATVAKVGRSLVTIINEYGQAEVYRIETGRRNDAYGHQWLCTDEQHAEHEARTAAHARLRSLGLEFKFGHAQDHSWATINAACDVLESARE